MSKHWEIKAGNGEKVRLTPIFEQAAEGTDVECKSIVIRIKDTDYVLNFMNLFQFIYFVSNEELRMGLAQRYQRRVNNLPYDVSFKLSPDEIKNGFAKRRIELPVDEITMAIARNEAWKLMPGVANKVLSGTKPNELFRKK